MQYSINSIDLNTINEQVLFWKNFSEDNFENEIKKEVSDEDREKRANASQEDLDKLATAKSFINVLMPSINSKLEKYKEKQNSTNNTTISDNDQAVLDSTNNLINTLMSDKSISTKYNNFMKKYHGKTETNQTEISSVKTTTKENSSDIFSNYQSMVNKVRIKNGMNFTTTSNNTTNSTSSTQTTQTTQTTANNTKIEKLTKLGNELLTIQNKLAKLVESAKELADVDAEDTKYQAYIKEYTESYNELVAKKEEYDKYSENLSNLEIKRAKDNLKEKTSSYDNDITDIDVLSIETKLNQLPTELADMANELLLLIDNRKIIGYQIASFVDYDSNSAEIKQLQKQDKEYAQKEMELQNKLARYIQDNNIDTKSVEFQNMFAHFNASYEIYSEDLAYKIETIEEHIKACTIKQNSTEIDEAERTQTKAIQQIYEMELANLKTQQTNVNQNKNMFNNYDVEANIQTTEQINLNLKNLDYEYQKAEYASKIQSLNYQLATLIDTKAGSSEINKINNQIKSYENKIKNLENAIEKNETKFDKTETEHLALKSRKPELEKLINQTYQQLSNLTASNVSADTIKEVNKNLSKYEKELKQVENKLKKYN